MRVKSRNVKGLVIGGVATFVPFYAVQAAIGAGCDNCGFVQVAHFVPVVGPFMAAAAIAAESDDSFGVWHTILGLEILNGFGQLGGALMLVVGLTATEKVLVYEGSALRVELPSFSPLPGGGALTLSARL